MLCTGDALRHWLPVVLLGVGAQWCVAPDQQHVGLGISASDGWCPSVVPMSEVQPSVSVHLEVPA